MKFLIALFRYFPYGGLQKDFLRIAEELLRRGHQVLCVCMEWDGPVPSGLEVRKISCSGCSNHGKAATFEKKVKAILQAGDFDCSLTMNRMGGFDFYFVADNCFALDTAAKHSVFVQKLLPRYRIFLRQEQAVFSADSATRIFTIVDRQKPDYQKVYHTADSRFLALPPGMNEQCRLRPEEERMAIRHRIREELNIPEQDCLLVQVASSPGTKGMDRSILALADVLKRIVVQQPDGKALADHIRLLLVGIKEPAHKVFRYLPAKFMQEKVIFAGARDDVPELLTAADLMIHPARNEAAGTVLIESIACACPVICSGACGFSSYVRESGGIVLPEPYNGKKDLEPILLELLTSPDKLQNMKQCCQNYAVNADFYRRAVVAADYMEDFVRQKSSTCR